MDRQILFRGFYEKHEGTTTIIVDGKEVQGEWIYGCYAKFKIWRREEILPYIQPVNMDGTLEVMQKVIPVTVGQYTGVDDNAGKKIFEGDKYRAIKDGTNEICGDIIFKRGCFSFKEKYSGECLGLDDFDFLEKFTDFKCEVIGTIFDR